MQSQSDELQKAINGESNAVTFTSYMGTEAVGAFAPVQTANIKWAIAIKQDSSEIYAHLNQLTSWLIILLIVAAAIIIALTTWYVRSLVHALHLLVQAGSLLSVGDANLSSLTAEERKYMRERKDEIGAIARSFTRMIGYQKDAAEVTQKIAAGDLTVEVTAKSDQDLIGNSLVEMVKSLRSLIQSVRQSAETVNAAAKQLSSAAEQAGQATSQITLTMQQVATGTSDQSQAANQTAQTMENMSQAVTNVANGAKEQMRAVEKTVALADELSSSIQHLAEAAQNGADGGKADAEASLAGEETVKNTIDAINTIRAKVGQSAEKVQEMGTKSNQIGLIIETIDDIATQTNLLALNAAIESARAGEHGKGFAVVADEVRKLAERSSVATKEIGTLIKSIQSTVAEAIIAMQDGINEVEKGVVRANQAGQALSSIRSTSETVSMINLDAVEVAKKALIASGELASAMGNVSAVVNDNQAATHQMTTNSDKINQAVENIASISEENSASVEEVSAAAEEMAAQVEEVSASAQSLTDMAQQLMDMVLRFRINNAS